MQRDQRPQPKEVEAAVSVQTNEPAKKRLYDYDYALWDYLRTIYNIFSALARVLGTC